MANLYDTAKSFQKKDITSLPALDLKTLNVQEGTFGEGTDKRSFKYIEIDGWKYTLKANVIEAIKEVIDNRPTTTKVKVYAGKDGELKVMPLD